MELKNLKVEFAKKSVNEIREKILKPYKEKYKEHDTEYRYVSYLELTLKDAENNLTLPYVVIANNEPVGILSLSAASIKVLETDWELYEDYEELPAIRIDLFLIFPKFRGKGLGSKTIDKLIAFLKSKQKDFIGYRYITTLSTNEKFDKLLLSKTFKPLIPEDITDKVDEIMELKMGTFLYDYTVVEILRKDLKQNGIWFYLEI